MSAGVTEESESRLSGTLTPLCELERPASDDHGDDLPGARAGDRELDRAVVDEDPVTGDHVAPQVRVAQTGVRGIAFTLGGDEPELAPGVQHGAGDDVADAQLGARQVEHDGHHPAGHPRRFARGGEPAPQVGARSVRGVEAHHVGAGRQDANEHARHVARRSHRRDDLGPAHDRADRRMRGFRRPDRLHDPVHGPPPARCRRRRVDAAPSASIRCCRTRGARGSRLDSPSSSSMRRSALYLATRSLRAGAPVLIWPAFTATATSAIVVSSVSPLRCEMTHV